MSDALVEIVQSLVICLTEVCLGMWPLQDVTEEDFEGYDGARQTFKYK